VNDNFGIPSFLGCHGENFTKRLIHAKSSSLSRISDFSNPTKFRES
jgi:hypothetical protein